MLNAHTGTVAHPQRVLFYGQTTRLNTHIQCGRLLPSGVSMAGAFRHFVGRPTSGCAVPVGDGTARHYRSPGYRYPSLPFHGSASVSDPGLPLSAEYSKYAPRHPQRIPRPEDGSEGVITVNIWCPALCPDVDPAGRMRLYRLKHYSDCPAIQHAISIFQHSRCSL